MADDDVSGSLPSPGRSPLDHDLNAIPLRNIIATWTACVDMAYAKCFFVSEVQGEGGHRPAGWSRKSDRPWEGSLRDVKRKGRPERSPSDTFPAKAASPEQIENREQKCLRGLERP